MRMANPAESNTPIVTQSRSLKTTEPRGSHDRPLRTALLFEWGGCADRQPAFAMTREPMEALFIADSNFSVKNVVLESPTFFVAPRQVPI